MKSDLLRRTMWIALLSTLLLTTAAFAQNNTTTVIITMDELLFQPVNGLTVKGVTFHDTTGADFDYPNGGQLTYTQDPVIEGQTAGETITMDFPYPVSSLRFGMALSGQGTFTNALTVALYNSALNLLESVPVTIGNPAGDAFSNGEFVSPAGGLISRAVITFNAGVPSAFGLDNVAFSTDYYQVRYAANLNIGDSVVDFTNTGANASNLCVNLYTFDPAEELISCCTCTVTPNALQSLSVLKSLISNTLTPSIPTSVVVKAVATAGPTCNAAAPTFGTLAPGLLTWGTTLHQNTSVTAATYAVTETPFANAILSAAELAHIATTCGFIQSDGSGFGICKGCAAGGLGATVAQ
jgi:hypothetical protein